MKKDVKKDSEKSDKKWKICVRKTKTCEIKWLKVINSGKKYQKGTH